MVAVYRGSDLQRAEVDNLVKFAAKGIVTDPVFLKTAVFADFESPSSRGGYTQTVKGADYCVNVVVSGPYPMTSRAFEPVLKDWREALVFIAAHEFAHVHEFACHLPENEEECNRKAEERLAALRELRVSIELDPKEAVCG